MALPTQTEMFANALKALDTARNSLSDARDWLNADWRPVGSSLPDAAGTARWEAMGKIGPAKGLIDEMKEQLHTAMKAIDTTR